MAFTDISIGVDLIEVPRIQAALSRWGERFERRVFTEDERAYCSSRARPYQSYAARFAAKEAAMKALGTGWRGLDWKEIEVARERSGRPPQKYCEVCSSSIEPHQRIFSPFLAHQLHL